MDLRFRFAKQEDLKAVNSFNPNNLTVWRQEFFSDSKPHSYLAICEVGDKVIGTEGYVEYRLLENGKPILSHRSERTLVSTDFRGKNLFSGMVEICRAKAEEEGSQFCWGATAARKAFERVGFHYREGYRTYAVLPISSGKFFFGHLPRGRSLPGNPLKLFRKLRVRDIKTSKEAVTAAAQSAYLLRRFFRPRAGVNLHHLHAPKSWQDLADLHNRIQTSGTLITLQHEEQLFKWLEQEGENRLLKIFSYEGDKLRAYLCIGLDERDSYAPVLDFAADSIESLSAAVLYAKNEVSVKDYSALFFAINFENAEQRAFMGYLKRLGASSFGRVGTWVVQPLCRENSQIYDDMSCWYLTDLWFALYNRKKL